MNTSSVSSKGIPSTSLLLFFLVLMMACIFHSASGLECYVCRNQENNKDKCVETVKTCDMGQDRCLTEVRWGGMPYWAPSGEKQYYISKRCASSDNCTSERDKVSHRCDRIWYNDWECVECCHGDRCNYYVTLSGHLEKPHIISIVSSLVTIIFMSLIQKTYLNST